MSQHDYVINNDSGASVRADINSALQAILSQNSGTSEPTSTSAGTLWLDTTGGAPYTLKIRDAGNNHWLTIGSVTDPGADGNLELLPGKINLPSSGGIYESDGSTEILTESSGAVTLKNTTLDSSVIYPDGFVTNVINRKLHVTNGAAASAFTNNTTGERIFSRTSSSSTTVPSFTAKQGYTYFITLSFFAITGATGGSTSGRVADFMLYVGTTSRSQGDSTVDTFLNEVRGGRNLISATSSATSSYLAINLTGSFYQSSADATTYYYGSSLVGSSDKQVLNYMSETHPMYEKIIEVKGNVLTINT